MALKQNYEKIRTSLLIVGAGGAGLKAAIEASKITDDILIVTRSLEKAAHTTMAEGGINAALGNIHPKDSCDVHLKDTVVEGHYINNQGMVKILTKEIPKRILELERLGGIFDRTPEGKIAQRKFGAQTYHRTCYVGDRTGHEILNTLVDEVRKRRIPWMKEVLVTALLKQGNRVVGATAIDLKTGSFIIFETKAIVFATGGGCRIFKRTTNPAESTGDGFAVAYKAGAELMDMEMVQFHPTGMVYPESAVGVLVTEAVRGEGGILLNSKGERFMQEYDPERMEVSARDIVARAIFKEIAEGRGTKHGGVYLDISSQQPASYIKKKLPGMHKQFLDFADVDITKEPMEVAPTAHYFMGGVKINPKNCSCTTIKGLFLAGEVCSGLHGANRLGGNSLAETQVFGAIAGKEAAKFTKNSKHGKVSSSEVKKEQTRIYSFLGRNSNIKPQQIKKELQELMWNNVSIVREGRGLLKTLKRIELLRRKADELSVSGGQAYNPQWHDVLDVVNMLIVAEAVVRSALERKESRGAHYRSDFPEKNNGHWLKNINVKLGRGGRMAIYSTPVTGS